jgi:hypothetical protein
MAMKLSPLPQYLGAEGEVYVIGVPVDASLCSFICLSQMGSGRKHYHLNDSPLTWYMIATLHIINDTPEGFCRRTT